MSGSGRPAWRGARRRRNAVRRQRRRAQKDPVQQVLDTQPMLRQFIENEFERGVDLGLGRGDVDNLRIFVSAIMQTYGTGERAVSHWLDRKLTDLSIEVHENDQTVTGLDARLHDLELHDDMDPRRVTAAPHDDGHWEADVWAEKARAKARDVVLRRTITKICASFGRDDRRDDMLMLISRLLVKFEMTIESSHSELPVSHLLHGAVQLGKTLVAVLLSSAVSNQHEATAIVYLSDNQTDNHAQNVADFLKLYSLGAALPASTVVAGDLNDDHKPSNRDSYSTHILDQARITLDEHGCVVLPCKKNSSNMRALLDSVLTPLSDSGRDFRLIVLNDEADASTAMPDPETYNASMEILNDILNLPQATAVLHITATPQAVLSLPSDEKTAPVHVTVMQRPESYVSSHYYFLDPSGHSRHVSPFRLTPDLFIPFEQYRSDTDVRILRNHRQRAENLLRRLVLHHTLGCVMLRHDDRFGPTEKDHSALLQLNRAKDVQREFHEMLKITKGEVSELFEKASQGNTEALREIEDAYFRVVSIRETESPLREGLDEATLVEMAETCRETDLLLINGNVKADDRRLPRGRDPAAPFNGLIISLKMMERARRVPGLHTTVIMHHPKKQMLDLGRQRDRGSGHTKKWLDYVSYWVSPKQDNDLVGIAAADERTRTQLVARDRAGLDLRYEDLYDVLLASAGGVPTSRLAASSRAEEQSSSEFTRQRFDRGTTELEPIADIEERLQALHAHSAIKSEEESPHPSKDRSPLLMTDGRGLAEILSDRTLGLIKPHSSSSESHAAIVGEMVEWADSNPDHPVVIVLALNGSGSRIMQELNPKMRISVKTAVYRDGVIEVLGSLASGSGNAAVSDWHTDKPTGLLSPSGRRIPEAPMLLLLKVVRFREMKLLLPDPNDEGNYTFDTMSNSEDPEGHARLMMGVDAPAGLGGGSGSVSYSRPPKKEGTPLHFTNLEQEANSASTAPNLSGIAGIDTRD